ncbi:alpha/beta hydrolase [Demequina capsici]|uniref:Alpha/beta hydrolase fold domain-containing protein n=1 Tax=Demequina capsici TaxID=3075620 RepID=A0AA96F4X9_9MICO|nr:alpha/beta hydrolase fold domain-containing protein [Demequina sp. OYTSA14]WNM23829.1 alpha/beta hydrolase fold domain-containing protein [Demequina sp. OYTSA14]
MPSRLTRLDVEAAGTDAPFKARLYRTSATCDRALVWAHGGAFMFGDLDMPEADAVAAWLAEHGWAVLSVDYRLAPMTDFESLTIGEDGHPFPAAHDDLIAAFDWMVAHAEDLGCDADQVLLGGASAGANLAAGVAVALRDRAQAGPAGLLLAYPIVHAQLPDPSDELREAVRDVPPEHRFPPEIVTLFNLNYVGGDASLLTDPRAFPGEGDPTGLPRTLIVNSEKDDLRSSGERYAAQLAAAGVAVECSYEAGAEHGFLNEPDNPAFERTLARFLTWSASR